MVGVDAVAVVAGPGEFGGAGDGGLGLVLLAGDGVVEDEREFEDGLGGGDASGVDFGARASSRVVRVPAWRARAAAWTVRAVARWEVLGEGDLVACPVGAGENEVGLGDGLLASVAVLLCRGRWARRPVPRRCAPGRLLEAC
ncbi:hypothetical protein ACFWB2_43695 [Streptomyces virginiae]|uniref:hypothetical protein n=1 Tax=Streptomyces virginiae TaxID=1961 RepID=UPI00368B1264